MKLLILFLLALPWTAKAQEEPNPNTFIIDQIECVGNENTSCDLIQKEIYLNSGDNVSEDELSNAKIRLKLKNLFTSVNISLKKGSERGHVNIVIEVQEANPLYTETTLGFTQGESWEGNRKTTSSVGLTVGHRNLFGTGKILQGSVDVYEPNVELQRAFNFNLNYSDPHVLGSKKVFFNLGLHHFNNPSALTQLESFRCYECYFQSQMKNTDSYSASLGYRIFDFSFVSLNVRGSKSNYIASHSKNNYELENNYSSNEFKSIDYGWNSEDDTYFATEGSRFNFGIGSYTYKYTTKFSDSNESAYTYTSLDLRFKKTWNWSLKHIFALNFGFSDFNRSTSSDYYLGNPGYSSSFQYAYQFKTNLDADISRSRWYFGMNPGYSSNWGVNSDFETGFILEHKKMGILKLSLTQWGNRWN